MIKSAVELLIGCMGFLVLIVGGMVGIYLLFCVMWFPFWVIEWLWMSSDRKRAGRETPSFWSVVRGDYDSGGGL